MYQFLVISDHYSVFNPHFLLFTQWQLHLWCPAAGRKMDDRYLRRTPLICWRRRFKYSIYTALHRSVPDTEAGTEIQGSRVLVGLYWVTRHPANVWRTGNTIRNPEKLTEYGSPKQCTRSIKWTWVAEDNLDMRATYGVKGKVIPTLN
jgi:hypothetical protein